MQAPVFGVGVSSGVTPQLTPLDFTGAGDLGSPTWLTSVSRNGRTMSGEATSPVCQPLLVVCPPPAIARNAKVARAVMLGGGAR